MNKRNILIALILVWVVVLVYNFGLFGGGKGTEQAKQRRKGIRRVAAAKDFPILNNEKLQRELPAFKKVRKDIFSPFSVASGSLSPTVTVSAQAVPSTVDPLEQLVSELSFIGFVENAREKTIFLGMGDDVVLVKKGAFIAGVARVVEITGRKMTLGDINGATDKLYEVSLE